jgi:hypothetical protein
MEFECIQNNVLPSRLNVTAANDHVGEVEQSIWTMKERARTPSTVYLSNVFQR